MINSLGKTASFLPATRSPKPRAAALPWLALLGLYLLIAGCLVSIAWLPLHTPVAASGDTAADMLLTNQIGANGWLLVGHYSRWDFNHPGPFWFYYNYLFEYLLGGLPLSRLQVWLIGSLVLNAALVVFSATAASLYFHQRIQAGFTAVFALALVGVLGAELVDTWMPNRLIAPYLAFLLCVLHLREGHSGYLPLAALLTAVLIHGYATLPLFTLPLLALALYLGHARVRVRDRTALRQHRHTRPLCAAVAIVLLFAVPLLIDAAALQKSNLYHLLAAQGRFVLQPKPSWAQMGEFIQALPTGERPIAWLVASLLAGVVLLVLRRDALLNRRIARVLGLALLVTLGMILYYKNTPAPLLPFIARFHAGVPLLALMAALSPLFGPWRAPPAAAAPASNWQRRAVAWSVTAALAAWAYPVRLLGPQNPGLAILAMAERIEHSAAGLASPVVIDYAEHDQWIFIAGLLLELERRKLAVCTPWVHMSRVYTPRLICGDKPRPDYRIVRAADCHGACFFASHELGAIRLGLKGIAAGETLDFASDKLEFIHWSDREKHFRWSAGKSSSLRFSIDTPLRGFAGELQLTAMPLGDQRLRIRLNDRLIYQGQLQASTSYLAVPFAPRALKAGVNTLQFELPDARQPGTLDRRELALAMKSISIR